MVEQTVGSSVDKRAAWMVDKKVEMMAVNLDL